MNTSKPEDVGVSSSRLQRINDLTARQIDEGKLAGTITLVARKGHIVHFQSSGKMSLETGVPMRDDAIFRIYSMTKAFIAVATMILYERGHFQLDTPVSKIIPEFKDLEVFESGTVDDYKTVKPDREMVMSDLLKHTSGLTYDIMYSSSVDAMYRKHGIGYASRIQDYDLAEFVKKLSKMPLLFSPGKHWQYSVGMDVLGYIIEVLSGLKLDAFFRKEIYEPLGLVDTDFYVPESKLDRFTTSYGGPYRNPSFVPPRLLEQFSDQDLFPVDDSRNSAYAKPHSFLSGSGGLVSTMMDYYTFLNMLLNKGRYGDKYMLSPKTVQLMTMNHLPGDMFSMRVPGTLPMNPPGIGMGYTFGVMVDPVKTGALGTKGSFNWGGAASTLDTVDPKEELIAIYMTQVFPDVTSREYGGFMNAVYQSLID